MFGFSPSPGQKLRPLRTHEVHPSGGPGHHVVRLGLGPGERPEHQVLQAEGGRGEGRVRQAHGEEEEGVERQTPVSTGHLSKDFEGRLWSRDRVPLGCDRTAFFFLYSCTLVGG